MSLRERLQSIRNWENLRWLEDHVLEDEIGADGGGGIPQGGPLTEDLDADGKAITGAVIRSPLSVKDSEGDWVASFTGDNGSFIQVNDPAAGPVLDISGANGQTGDLFEVDGNSGSVIVDADAVIHAPVGITDLPAPTADSDAATKGYVDDSTVPGIPQGGPLTETLVGGGQGLAGLGLLSVGSGGLGNPEPLRVRDSNSGGSLVVIHVEAAPSDVAVLERDCALWFDPFQGAAAFNLKGKDTNGTVVTATIPMAHVQILGWVTEPSDGAVVRYDQGTRSLESAQQAAIADANVGTLTLLGDALTAIGTLQTKLNAALAALRSAGVIAT